MPSLFRRKPTAVVEETVTEPEPGAESVEARRRGYTPGKGRETPKRPGANLRRPVSSAPVSKEEAKARRRAARAEAAAEFRREGGPRDRGPERRLARDVVDSRRTVGTWFFGGALVVLVGSGPTMPPTIRLASNILWVTLALGVVVDSLLISRKIKRLVRERFPKSQEKLGSLYFYAIMRSIAFRRMRTPVPQVKIGDPI
ncbi:DUF3043 domain-containing protein [Plantactinospora sp. GCM10030261]|uniref:DUF3043 domain-containing protein n=1 Tax=Plantactinospora sp. GCM10030261 TaxID=3273420 RepID=UPI0036170D6F